MAKITLATEKYTIEIDSHNEVVSGFKVNKQELSFEDAQDMMKEISDHLEWIRQRNLKRLSR